MATRRKPKGTPRNETPFKGDDPFSKTAATLFSIPGTLAQGFSDVASGRRKVSLGDIAGVVAPAALAAGGMAVARVRSSNSPAATRARVISSTRGALGGKPATYSNIKSNMRNTGYSRSVTPDPYGGENPWPGVPRGLAPSAKRTAISTRRQAAVESTYAIAKTQPGVLKPSQRNAIDAGAELGKRKSAVLRGIAYGYAAKPTKRGR